MVATADIGENNGKATSIAGMADGRSMQGNNGKTVPGVAATVAGILFIALGVLIVIEPNILVWAEAMVFVLLGIMMLMMASFIRKTGGRFQSMNQWFA